MVMHRYQYPLSPTERILKDFTKVAANCIINGFTTDSKLMKKAGITDDFGLAIAILAIVDD